MTEVHLQRNEFEGQLPASWAAPGSWAGLFWMDLWDNSLTGAVPATWGNWNAFPALEILCALSSLLPEPAMRGQHPIAGPQLHSLLRPARFAWC